MLIKNYSFTAVRYLGDFNSWKLFLNIILFPLILKWKYIASWSFWFGKTENVDRAIGLNSFWKFKGSSNLRMCCLALTIGTDYFRKLLNIQKQNKRVGGWFSKASLCCIRIFYGGCFFLLLNNQWSIGLISKTKKKADRFD